MECKQAKLETSLVYTHFGNRTVTKIIQSCNDLFITFY